MHELLATNLNFFWGGILAETLSRRGLQHVVLSPGSRSAPLTTALALHPALECLPVLDERSAAFYALGLARASGRPTALVCTSGTAAANYLPAVVEAHYGRVPLILLTADRPPELRECAAGQAIDQLKLYGHHVSWQHELALPDEAKFNYLRNTLRQAWDRAVGGSGPIHLNIPFREPLAPLSDGKTWVLPGNFYELAEIPPLSLGNTAEAFDTLREIRRGIIVCGPASPTHAESYVLGIEELVRVLGWPVLADALSPIRHRSLGCGARVGCYEKILRDTALHASLKPEAVLQIGTLPTSKTLRAFLQAAGARTWILDPGIENLDPLQRAHIRIPARAEDLQRLGAYRGEDSDFFVAWAAAENVAREELADGLLETEQLFEGALPYHLAEHLPPGTPVFVASSMPVRDAEFFWPVNQQEFQLVGNRGANGIDGTLSTALGYAHAKMRPAVLVTGDLAFLHDQNGLLIAPEFPGSLTVIVINNKGGGIFEHLPIARFEPPFERFFATPQAVDLEKLAAAHGLAYHCPMDWEAFAARLADLPAKGIQLIELKTDRRRDAATRQALLNPDT